MTRGQTRPWPVRSVVGTRVLLAALAWLLLTEGDLAHWPLALLVVAAAAAASLRLLPTRAWRWRLRGVLAFLPFFLAQSLRGGVDVSRRALSPRLPLEPRFLEYRLRLRSEVARVFFTNVVGLLPGSASTLLRDDVLHVHVLDARLPVGRALAVLEQRVAALFDLEPPGQAPEGGGAP